MNSNLEQIQKRTWKKFFLLQNEIFLTSYQKVLDNFLLKTKHNDQEIKAILFCKCYHENFDLIQSNLEKTETELKQENENYKKMILSSKENLEILALSNKFIKNIKNLNNDLKNLVLFAFAIISLTFIKDANQQQKIINEYIDDRFYFSNKNEQKYFYKALEKTWKESIDQIYQEFVEQENEKTKTEWEKSALISFNYFNKVLK